MVNKSFLREKIRVQLKSVSKEARDSASTQACLLLEKQIPWKNANAILFYAPIREELNIWPLFQHALSVGKIVCLPRFDPGTNRYAAHQISKLDGEIHSGRFDIREPRPDCPAIPLNRLDLILVPGVAFDLRGRRLGRGRGFYDQLLADARGTKCGVAFDEQIVAEIPVEPHDITVDCILTPTRWLECAP
ncbi:MAG TPA: 5-formyltetrahydrofolate cyclo-ligase [Verrucomicrobiae bacterium]|nr:5-formyltetrahydrofolate cyclo-ligase [Verrucomicrobiae bacterium]